MKTLTARLQRNSLILALATGLTLFVHFVLQVSLRPAAVYSGWLLAALVTLLASYNLFKKVSFLPLGASVVWLQIHIYAGLLSILVFVLHAGPRLPHGPLGWMLTVLFAGVAGSGVIGLVMSRTFPALLRARGPEVIFEQIPVLRRIVRERAEQLVLQTVEQQQSTVIADFYVERLQWFFAGPRNFWRHVLRLANRRDLLLTAIDAQERYLDEQERPVVRELRLLVKEKDNLDFQHALQSLLKLWLFAHVPLTCALCVFAVMHVLVVYAYK